MYAMQTIIEKTGIMCPDSNLRAAAEELSDRFNLPIVNKDNDLVFFLVLTTGGLELRHNIPGSSGPLSVNFSSPALSYRRRHGGGRKEPLARAVGLKSNRCPYVLDATAGLGRDSFILASLGCKLLLVERSPLLAALLQDGLNRALADPDLAEIAARMKVTLADTSTLTDLSPIPDVIYMDPMYPHRTKSALVKKEMRIIRALVGDDPDSSQLLSWAFSFQGARIVVKRPKGAPTLDGKKPSAVIHSKKNRFDIYLRPQTDSTMQQLSSMPL